VSVSVDDDGLVDVAACAKVKVFVGSVVVEANVNASTVVMTLWVVLPRSGCKRNEEPQ
jgi:hypothetical protein